MDIIMYYLFLALKLNNQKYEYRAVQKQVH